MLNMSIGGIGRRFRQTENILKYMTVAMPHMSQEVSGSRDSGLLKIQSGKARTIENPRENNMPPKATSIRLEVPASSTRVVSIQVTHPPLIPTPKIPVAQSGTT